MKYCTENFVFEGLWSVQGTGQACEHSVHTMMKPLTKAIFFVVTKRWYFQKRTKHGSKRAKLQKNIQNRETPGKGNIQKGRSKQITFEKNTLMDYGTHKTPTICPGGITFFFPISCFSAQLLHYIASSCMDLFSPEMGIYFLFYFLGIHWRLSTILKTRKKVYEVMLFDK